MKAKARGEAVQYSHIPSSAYFSAAARKWWGSVSALFNGYARAIAAGEDASPPPAELAVVLASVAGFLEAGTIPPVIANIGNGKQGRAPGPPELHDIGLAVAYHKACQPNGLEYLEARIKIDDHSPTATLMDWFKVSRSTVQGWTKTRDPAFLGAGQIDATILSSLTKKAGHRYAQLGRSTSAIRSRDPRQRPPFTG